MLTSIEGIYEDGQVRLLEPLPGIDGACRGHVVAGIDGTAEGHGNTCCNTKCRPGRRALSALQ